MKLRSITNYSKKNFNMKSKKIEIKKFFDSLAVDRNKKISSHPIILYEQEMRGMTAIKLLEVNKGDKVLDIGCGNARDLINIANAGGRVFGVDISKEMIIQARKDLDLAGNYGKRVFFSIGDVCSLDFPDSYFDKVLCSEVIEHVIDIKKALNEIHRVLKPGGSFVLTTPNKNSWYGFERRFFWEGLLGKKWPHPLDNWQSVSEISYLINKAGFNIYEKRTVCFIPGFMITYFLMPNIIQILTVRFVSFLESTLQFFLKSFGYTICIKSICVKNV